MCDAVPKSSVWKRYWVGPKSIKDSRKTLSTGQVFVPVVGRDKGRWQSTDGESIETFADKRYNMFMEGCYPGVEYKVLEMREEDDDVLLTIKPAYPLIPQLMREWPVSVKLSTIPYVLTKGMYNTITVIGSAGLAFTLFLSALALSQAFTISVVNTRSMQPYISPGDRMVVEKVSPVLKKLLSIPPKIGDVIFFREPAALKDYIKRNNLPPIKAGDLLVKRVAGVITQAEGGGSTICLTMLGDNPAVSVDSRDFGCVPLDAEIGTPVLRVLPLSRFGPLE